MSERPGEHDQRPDDDVVDVELVRVEAEPGAYERYTGKVVKVQSGFCFIGSVRRGTQTIATGGDVFCPMDQFKVGDTVIFDELNPDREHPGKHRTERAEKVFEIAMADGATRPVTALSLRQAFDGQRSAYHSNAKKISDKDIVKAMENQPFDTALAQLAASVIQDASTVAHFAERYLQDDLFAMLKPFEVSPEFTKEIDEKAEADRIDQMALQYEAADMKSQANSLREQYRKFAGARRVFGLMHKHGILRVDTIVPIRYLPEMLVACPVWFHTALDGSVIDTQQITNPDVARVTRWICDQVPTQEFAWFYQLYNRRMRPLGNFNSNVDIMPPDVMKVMIEARKVFDVVAIATPYHDLASTEWQTARWIRQRDPFLLAFNHDVPFIFILGRWSGTGLFPLFLDMIADTMAHLEQHKTLLANIHPESRWYRGQGWGSLLLGGSNGTAQNTVLRPFADQVLAAYRDGRLFQFLRGEKPELTAAEK